MIRVICVSTEQIDAIWRLLAHVPDDMFVPVAVYLSGTLIYNVIRTAEGEQTTVPPADQPGYTTPDP
jgi:hypothetical protein